LQALSDEDNRELAKRLETAASLDGGRAADAAEGERMELLAGIAGELRGMIGAEGLAAAGVYIDLLQHLAAPAAGARAISAAASLQ
jgi:hypothetical protein